MQDRLYPLNRPAGHVLPIPRYSARFPGTTERLVALFAGVQAEGPEDLAASGFEGWVEAVRGLDGGPDLVDWAVHRDGDGLLNRIAALYWRSSRAFDAWASSEPVRVWREGAGRLDAPWGSWWEPVGVPPARTETIAFKEHLRGLSACPFSRIEPTEGSGYWGAARDRIPASAHDRLEGSRDRLDRPAHPPLSRGGRLAIRPPPGLALIRSGVSWAACGEEQRLSYETNIRPKLDAGMEYLRSNPVETGCCSLRQVTVTDVAGRAQEEGYSLGMFLSLGHLEAWARHHPTHLAIYHRAMAERKKYQERLELRTYNEIYVIDGEPYDFEYVNCGPNTGLIPFFAA